MLQEFEISTRRCITGWTWTPRKAPQERKTSIIAGYSQNTEDPGTICVPVHTYTCSFLERENIFACFKTLELVEGMHLEASFVFVNCLLDFWHFNLYTFSSVSIYLYIPFQMQYLCRTQNNRKLCKNYNYTKQFELMKRKM